jgi:hypothetical protein
MNALHKFAPCPTNRRGIEAFGCDVNKPDAIQSVATAKHLDFAKAERTASIEKDLDVKGTPRVTSNGFRIVSAIGVEFVRHGVPPAKS